jgi:hypothetical protein
MSAGQPLEMLSKDEDSMGFIGSWAEQDRGLTTSSWMVYEKLIGLLSTIDQIN